MASHNTADRQAPSKIAAGTFSGSRLRKTCLRLSREVRQEAALPMFITDILDSFCWRHDNTVEHRKTRNLNRNLLENRVSLAASPRLTSAVSALGVRR